MDAGAFAVNASPPLPRAGLYWGPMRGGNGVPGALRPAWPRMFWPLMAAPYFALSRDVAFALCAMRESSLPLRESGPPSYWVGVALRTLEGLAYVDSASGREVEAWPAVRGAAAPDAAAAAPPREKVDIVLVVPNPWPWAERRRAQFEAFLATARRARGAFTAKLIFVMGSESVDGLPARESPDDAPARAHADVLFVTAPACPDADAFVPSRWDGQQFPPTNSSTTCKVLEGIAVAVERFEFNFLARVGDDAYFRWDYFLRERAAALPARGLYLGSINSVQHVFDHLKPVFGGVEGEAVLFFPYATLVRPARPPHTPRMQNTHTHGQPPSPPHKHNTHIPLPNRGQGWVLSPDVARYLAQGYRRLPRLRTVGPEDAAIALHLRPFQISPVHTKDFHGVGAKGGASCTATSLLVHYMTPALWAAIDPGTGVLVC